MHIQYIQASLSLLSICQSLMERHMFSDMIALLEYLYFHNTVSFDTLTCNICMQHIYILFNYKTLKHLFNTTCWQKMLHCCHLFLWPWYIVQQLLHSHQNQALHYLQIKCTTYSMYVPFKILNLEVYRTLQTSKLLAFQPVFSPPPNAQ